jgi:hypothetical protein
MRALLVTVLGLASAAFACSTSSSRTEPAAQPHDTGAAPTPPTRNPQPTMTPFDQALAAFRHAASIRTSIPEADLRVGPMSQEVAEREGKDTNTGELWAFFAEKGHTQIRGWASAGGTTITSRDELGALMRAARALDPAASLDAGGLASRVAWALGNEYRLARQPGDFKQNKAPSDFAPPTLKRSGDGATLVFFAEYSPFNEDGGKPDVSVVRATVEIAADYKTIVAIEDL